MYDILNTYDIREEKYYFSLVKDSIAPILSYMGSRFIKERKYSQWYIYGI